MESSDFDSLMSKLNENDDSDSKTIVKRGKNSKSDIVAYGINFDSNEELEFYEWILEAEKLGFVSDFEYQPKSYVLYDGMKNERGKFVVRPHVYTADFRIAFTDKWMEFARLNKIKVFNDFFVNGCESIIDVKGAFNRFGGDRQFSATKAFMLYRYGIYVWKIVPKKFFEKTWLPERCVFTKKTKKISTKYANYKTFANKKFATVALNSEKHSKNIGFDHESDS